METKELDMSLQRLILLNAGLDIDASQEEKYEFVIAVSKSRVNFDQIKEWLTQKRKKSSHNKKGSKN
jgi:death on curing protein